MPSEINGWKCSWCSRCFGRRCDVNRHEDACNNNPMRRHCRTCIHGVIGLISSVKDESGFGYDDLGPYCDYHKKPMNERPYYVECDMNDTDYGPEFPIPGTCLAYEYKGCAGWSKGEKEGLNGLQQ